VPLDAPDFAVAILELHEAAEPHPPLGREYHIDQLSQGGIPVELGMELPDGWIMDHRTRLDQVRQVWQT
jgi:hypothetical protein